MLRISLLNKFKRPNLAARRAVGRRLAGMRRRTLALDFLQRLGLIAGTTKRRGFHRSTFRQRSWPLIQKSVVVESAALETEDDFLTEPSAVAPDLPVDIPAEAQESEIEPMATPAIEEAANNSETILATNHPTQLSESSVTAMPQSEKSNEKVSGRSVIEELGEPSPATYFSQSPETAERSIVQALSPVTPKETEPNKQQELFASSGQDRSPQAWAARLLQSVVHSENAPQIQAEQNRNAGKFDQGTPQKQRAATFVPASARSVTGGKKLSTPARMFLKPLLGFDPGDIPVEEAEKNYLATRQLDAATEAATDGETIILKPEISRRTPEQLGLLAHELTHVVRSKQPRFVPPVARETGEMKPILASAKAWEPAQSVVQSEHVESASAMRLLTEEELARRVEARVLRKAAETARVPQRLIEEELAAGEPGETRFVEPRLAQSQSAPEVSEAERSGDFAAGQSTLTGSFNPPDSEQGRTSDYGSFQSAVGGETVSSASTQSSTPAGASLHRAERGREIAEIPATLNGATQFGKQRAFNLDALADQVYFVLKRRLAAERRRESM